MENKRGKGRRERKERASQAVKLVIRHLPPTMTEEEFLQQVEPLPNNDAYYYCEADWSLGLEATCRAYIDMSMKDMLEILQFRDRFDGYVFVDAKGVEYMAIVEYAPFQNFLKNKARSTDNKMNTIEDDPHYQEYLQKLADDREELNRLCETKLEFTLEHKSDDRCKSTPLLQYLANKKEKRREEARKRNEEKKKNREMQNQQRILEQPEASKQKEGAADNKKPIGPNHQKTGSGQGQGQGQSQSQAQEESSENSRSKRRTERNQRRRKEHEQRKLGRERDNRDKNKNEPTEKVAVQKRPSNQPIKRESQKKNEEFVILKKETKPVESDVESKIDIVPEISKDTYSQRLSATWEPAESSKEIDPEEALCVLPSTSKGIVSVASLEKDLCLLPSTSKGIVPVATIEKGLCMVQSTNKGVVSHQEPAENPKKLKEVPKTESEKEHSMQQSTSKSNSARLAEERRIRNKDRPSIAIYQPKVRMRMGSDETSPTECKDAAPSFEVDDNKPCQDNKPTSRRHNRRNRQKPQESSSNVK